MHLSQSKLRFSPPLVFSSFLLLVILVGEHHYQLVSKILYNDLACKAIFEAERVAALVPFPYDVDYHLVLNDCTVIDGAKLKDLNFLSLKPAAFSSCFCQLPNELCEVFWQFRSNPC